MHKFHFIVYRNIQTGLFYVQAIPSSIYLTLKFINSIDDSPRTHFVENVQRKKAKRSAIIVQEEIQSKYVSKNFYVDVVVGRRSLSRTRMRLKENNFLPSGFS